MKNKNQVVADESEQEELGTNGANENTNVKLTKEDKEKGNLKNFTISKKTIKKLKARNIEFLFPIQVESFTPIYEQNDCLIQASNGTGKTLAYALPIVELLQNDKSVELASGRAPRVLVLAPTRDAAKQISDDFQSIVNDLIAVPVYAAKKKSDDQETAVANGSDIVVATPDRLKEFLDNEKVDLSEVKYVVLDDVDQMLESSVAENVKKILKQAFASETKAQLVVFSETLSDSVRKLTKKYLSAEAVTVNLADKSEGDSSADDEGFDETAQGSSANVSSKADDGSRSLLTKQENYTTYQLTTNEEIKSVGFVFTILRKCLGEDFDAKSNVSQIAFTKDYTTAVFDLPSEFDEQVQSAWKDSARTQLAPATELPELDESSMTDNKSYNSRGNNNRSGGGAGAGRSSGCFNCGKDGHRSFECTEPKKAGGGGGRSGGGSNACFNCGQEGHKSFECTEPKKAGGGGGGGGCFNCGKDGHKSFECPEPKKGRPSFGGGGGGRGGGRGGARGGGAKRTFGGNDNGHSAGDVTNKKIKFDDDDD